MCELCSANLMNFSSFCCLTCNGFCKSLLFFGLSDLGFSIANLKSEICPDESGFLYDIEVILFCMLYLHFSLGFSQVIEEGKKNGLNC